MRDVHRFACATIVSILLLAPTTVATEIIEAPRPIIPKSRPLGYDWTERPHATHVPVQLDGLVVELDLSKVKTRWMDLEVSPLSPGKAYYLDGVDRAYWTEANEQGVGVFWNVRVTPGPLVLTAEGLDEPVATLVPDGGKGAMSFPLSFRWHCWWWCSDERPEPPQAVSTQNATRYVTLQAAYSFVETATIKITGCWTHDASIGVSVSGGQASVSGSAGGTYTSRTRECIEFESTGQPFGYVQSYTFRNDSYQDGSSKVYSTGKGFIERLTVLDVYFYPTPPVKTLYADARSVKRLTESATLGVGFDVGVKVFGVGLSVDINSAATDETIIDFILNPPAPNTRYYYETHSNDPSHALMPAIWGENPWPRPGP